MYFPYKPVRVFGGRCDNLLVSSIWSGTKVIFEWYLWEPLSMSLEQSVAPALSFLGNERAVTATRIVYCNTLAALAAYACWEEIMHLVEHINHININTVDTKHKTETDSKKLIFFPPSLSFASFLCLYRWLSRLIPPLKYLCNSVHLPLEEAIIRHR